MSISEEEALENELSQLEKRFKDLLSKINVTLRKELRNYKARKNVLPVKIILPRQSIEELLTYREFKRAWERKTRYVRTEKGWLSIPLRPNLGGIPVEEGDGIKVILTIIPRRKRRKKKSDREDNEKGSE